MKYKVFREFVQFRNWANTPNGEKRIVQTLTAMSMLLVVNVILLIIG